MGLSVVAAPEAVGPAHASTNGSNDIPKGRERTPAAPEEFEDFLSLYGQHDAVMDDRILTVLEKVLRCYTAHDENPGDTARRTQQSLKIQTVSTVVSHHGTTHVTSPQKYAPTPPAAAAITTGTIPLTPFSGRSGLRGLPQVIQLCSDKIKQGVPGYAEVLVRFLKRAEEPLNLLDVRDDRRQRQAVMRTLEAACSCLTSPSPEVRHAAAKVVHLTISDIRTKGFDDLDPPPVPQVRKRDTRFKGLYESDAVPMLCCYLAQPDAPPVESHLCLQALRDCSCYRVVVERLVTAGAIDSLVDMLGHIVTQPNYLQDGRTAVMIETLWNIMDLDPTCRRRFGTERNLSVALTLFVAFLKEGYRIKDKELRNDLLSIISLVAGDSACHAAFLQTGWMDVLWLASSGIELCPDDPAYTELVKPFATTTSQDDFDMKKLLWHVMYLLSFSEANLRFLLSKNIMNVPLAYLDPDCNVAAVLRWPTPQLVELQMQSLNLISQLCVGGAQELANNNGVCILLAFLEDHASEGLREVSLRVLARVATTNNRKQVAQAGAVKVMLELSETAPDLSMRCDCLHILAGIADGDLDCQREFAAEKGIETVMAVLHNYSNTNSQDADRYLFAAIDCAWCCIVGVPDSELEFIEAEGMHALLDILVVAPSWICVSLLSCLEDFIAKNNLAIAEMLEWRSNSGKSAPQIFIEMWRRDDAVNGAEKQGGVLPLDQTQPPFASRFGQTEVDAVLRSVQPRQEDGRWSSESLFQATTGSMKVQQELPSAHDIKVKIYCIFRRGLPSHSPAMMVLSDEEKVQLQVILSYAELKRDVVWSQIDDTLNHEGLLPIGLDRKRLELAKQSASTRWDSIRKNQLSLQDANQKVIDTEQRNFYKLLMKQPASTAGARDTMGLSITEAKIKKAQMLKRSFLSAASGSSPRASSGEVQAAADPSPFEGKSPACLADPSPRVQVSSKLEEEVVELLSRVRTDPGVLVEVFEKRLGHVSADGTIQVPGEALQVCVDGVEGMHETISFLKACRPVGGLSASPGLSFAARDHIEDQRTQQQGDVFSHVGSDKSEPLSRMNRYGLVVGESAESISLGSSTAMAIVCSLVSNDGVNSKVDRSNVFNPDFTCVGVACAEHPLHRYACCLDFAVSYQNKPRPEQQSIHSRFRHVCMDVSPLQQAGS